MNQEDKRIAIAAACGNVWKESEDRFWDLNGGNEGLSKDVVLKYHIPDYFNDLNAMKTAEDSLGVDDFHGLPFGGGGYQSTLEGMVGSGRVISASAALRAEAFGRTLGLWKEGE